MSTRSVDLGSVSYHPILAQRDGDVLLRELSKNLAPYLAEGIRFEFEKLTGLDLKHPDYTARPGDVLAIAPGIKGEVEDIETNQLAADLESLRDVLDGWSSSLEGTFVEQEDKKPDTWEKYSPAEKISYFVDKLPKLVSDLEDAQDALTHITELEAENSRLEKAFKELQLRLMQTEEDAKDLFDCQTKMAIAEAKQHKAEEASTKAQERSSALERDFLEAAQKMKTMSSNLTFLYTQLLPEGWEDRPDPWAEIQALFTPEF